MLIFIHLSSIYGQNWYPSIEDLKLDFKNYLKSIDLFGLVRSIVLTDFRSSHALC